MHTTIRRILLPTDFSEPAKYAQAYATELARQFGADLHLLHVLPELTLPLPDAPDSWTTPDYALKAHLEAAERQLTEGIPSDLQGEGRTVRKAMAGIAVQEIVKYATDHEIDLIVVGTHGRTGLFRLLLGSVAEKVVRLAPCPVLTVHPKGHQFLSEDITAQPASVPS